MMNIVMLIIFVDREFSTPIKVPSLFCYHKSLRIFSTYKNFIFVLLSQICPTFVDRELSPPIKIPPLFVITNSVCDMFLKVVSLQISSANQFKINFGNVLIDLCQTVCFAVLLLQYLLYNFLKSLQKHSILTHSPRCIAFWHMSERLFSATLV